MPSFAGLSHNLLLLPSIARPTMSPAYFQTAAGHRLAYSSAGNAQHPTVIFLHGGGQTRHAWDRSLLPIAQAGWHAMAVDMRGHGESDWPGHYRVSHFAEDVIELALAHSQPQKPVIIGASLGGMSALLANATPIGEVSRALVLVDVAPRLKAEGIDRILGFMAAYPNGFANLEEAAAAVTGYQPQRQQKTDHSGLKKNLRQKEDGRWYWHWDPTMLATFLERRHALDPEDEAKFHRAAAALKQSVLLVRGKQSDVIDDDIIAEFRQHVPHAEVADVSGAGHMVAGDRNDIFLEAITQFLKKIT